jgi:hypothetical protein
VVLVAEAVAVYIAYLMQKMQVGTAQAVEEVHILIMEDLEVMV